MSLYFIDATIDGEHNRYCIQADDPITALLRIEDQWTNRIVAADSIEIKEVTHYGL